MPHRVGRGSDRQVGIAFVCPVLYVSRRETDRWIRLQPVDRWVHIRRRFLILFSKKLHVFECSI